MVLFDDFIEKGSRVEFVADHKSKALTGKRGTVVKHKLNGVGWHMSVVELDDGGAFDLYWNNNSIWKYTDIPKPKPKPKPPRKISFKWAWYDLWMGVYVDTDNRTLYVCPLPTCLIKIQY